MGISSEQMVKEQWDLAVLMTKSENRFKRMEELNAPSVIMEQEIKLFNDRKKKLNGIGDTLVPYAQNYENACDERKKIINASLLGVFKDTVEGLDMFYEDLQTDISLSPFGEDEEEMNEYWRKFREGIESGNKKNAMSALWNILSIIFGDILWTNLPPVPSPLDPI